MFSLSPDSLSASASYCVLRDAALRESVIVSGRTLQLAAQTHQDFQRYALDAPLPPDHVRIVVGAFAVAVWRDPSRPELNVAYEPEPVEVLIRHGDPAVLAAEDRAADLALAAELAEPDPDSMEYYLTMASRRFAAALNLYA